MAHLAAVIGILVFLTFFACHKLKPQEFKGMEKTTLFAGTTTTNLLENYFKYLVFVLIAFGYYYAKLMNKMLENVAESILELEPAPADSELHI